MKVLHICTGYNLDFNGGITNYVRSISTQQAQNDNEVYILSDDGVSQQYKVIKFESKVPAWSLNKKGDKKSLKWIEQFVEDNQFDLIHLHMMLNIDQNLYKVLQNRKYVISLHDYYYICPRISMMSPNLEVRCIAANTTACKKCISRIEKNWFLLRATRKLFGNKFAVRFPFKSKTTYQKWYQKNKQLLENAEMLFPVSNRVKEIYQNSGIKNTYHVLHIGNISAENFDNVVHHEHDGKINLVLLSNVSKIKGGPLFFNIFRQVKNSLLQVHFYGRSSEEEKKIFNELNISDHGPYLQVELPQILSEMDMGIMTPIWEDNGPQTVMEMLNNHLPVFATKMGGITDFVNSSNGYLFDPYNESEINAAIDFLNELSFDKISEMRNSIKRTKTPLEHYNELMHYYQEIVCRQKV